jgi:hypothetical protein
MGLHCRQSHHPASDEVVKLIGFYSDEASVSAAMARVRLLEGFRDEPDCFMSGPDMKRRGRTWV